MRDPLAGAETLIDVLRARAAAHPERPAFTFLDDGERPSAALDFGHLAAEVERVAAALASTLRPGDRVLLAHPPGLDFVVAFLGCLRARVVAVPLPPTGLGDTAPAHICADADARAVLGVGDAAGAPRVLAHLPWIATPTVAAGGAPPPDPGGADVAFLQYTSGSTHTPRGVVVGHDNLVANQQMIREALATDAGSTFVSWLPPFHDMGLIGTVLHPVAVGAHAVLMPPARFLERPARWLRAISRFRADVSGGPNFGYELCVRRVTAAEHDGLDLSSWRVAFNGAEPVHADTIERFAATFAARGFRRNAVYPCYGLAEATLFVTGGVPGEGPEVLEVNAPALASGRVAPGRDRTVVACGRTWAGGKVAIVDAAGSQVGDDVVGAIHVRGPHVAGGYFRRSDDQSRAVFAGRLADGSGPWLDTGDLGFVHGGSLYVTGRSKDLIILRGRNHYPDDLERTAERGHPTLRPGRGACFAVDGPTGERLIVVHEVADEAVDAPAIASAVRRAIARGHGVVPHAVVLLRAGALPRTSSGKLSRSLCRERFLAGSFAPLLVDEADRDDGEPPAGPPPFVETLRREVARLVGVAPDDIATDRPLAEVGVDSVGVVSLLSLIARETGAAPTLPELLQAPSLLAIAYAAAAGPRPAEAAPPASPPLDEAGPALTRQQRGFWLLHQLAPGSSVHQVRAAAWLDGDVDVAALRGAVRALADRHPVLRTVFPASGGEPAPRVLPPGSIELATIDAGASDEPTVRARLVAEADAPFALDHGPLFRAVLVRPDAGRPALLVAAHHIVADLWSLTVLLGELDAMYGELRTGRPAAPRAPARTADDRASAERAWLASPQAAAARAFFRDAVAEAGEPLQLPGDRPRPASRSGRAVTEPFAIAPQTLAALRELGRHRGATLFPVLLAGLQALLFRYTGRRRFVIGSPTWGRGEDAWSDVVGCFVNTVVIPASLDGDPAFAELVARVRERALAALGHGRYPFPALVEELRPRRDTSGVPILQVLFTLQSTAALRTPGLAAFALGDDGARVRLDHLALSSIALPRDSVDFEIDVAAAEDGAGGLRGYVACNADVFTADTARALARRFERLLAGAAREPDRSVAELPLLDDGERAQLVGAWSETPFAWTGEVCLDRIFAAQARRTSARLAVIDPSGELDYAGLAAASERAAHALARAVPGAGEAPRIGLLLPASADFAVALFGALAAGCAVVPLETGDPVERLALIAEESGVAVLATDPAHFELARELARRCRQLPRIVLVDRGGDVRDPDGTIGTPGLLPPPDPERIAYVICTSGTTGRPKAVPITHANVAPLMYWQRDAFPLGEHVRNLQMLPLGFDFGLQELLTTLLFGGTWLAFPDEPRHDLRRRVELLRRFGVTMLYATPSLARALLAIDDAPLDTLRIVLLGGEALPRSLVRALRARVAPDCTIWNGYGPTEASINCAMFPVRCGDDLDAVSSATVPIGRPTAQSRLYVLDERMQPVPPGVPGELYIGGPGVSPGYLGQPGVNAERFLCDPFGHGHVYRSGDLVRWLADGNLEFLCRVDRQLKVNGYRVEPASIEAVLRRAPDVADVAVVPRPLPGDAGVRLLAVVVASPGARPDVAALRAHALAHLAHAEVPARFVFVDRLPLAPTRKLDTDAIALLDAELDAAAAHAEPPRDDVERAIAATFAELLGVPALGRHDNVFERGAHSLLLSRAHVALTRRLGREFPLIALFDHPTPAALAERLARRDPHAAIGPTVPPDGRRATRQQLALQMLRDALLRRRSRHD